MPQGSSVAPSWFTMVVNEVVKGLDRVLAYFDDAIVFNTDPIQLIANMRLFVLASAPAKSALRKLFI